MWTEIMSYVFWSPNQISMSTGVFKNLQRSQSAWTSLCHNGKTQQQCMVMPISSPQIRSYTRDIARVISLRISLLLLLYPNNSSIQQPDSQVKKLFNVPFVNFNYCFLSGNATGQWLCWWVVANLLAEAGPTGAHSVLEIIRTHDSSHRAAEYFCQLFNISGTLVLLDPGLSSWLHLSGEIFMMRTPKPELPIDYVFSIQKLCLCTCIIK